MSVPTGSPLPVPATVTAGSRLESLLATYATLKPEADELAARLKSVTDAIKGELTAQAPGARRIDVEHPTLNAPLRLSYVDRWELDTRKLKAEQPAVYAAYARLGGRWELRSRPT